MDNIKLYELSGAVRGVLDGMAVVNEDTGELFDLENIDSLMLALDEKVDSCGCYIRELTATYNALCEEASRFDKKAKAVRRRIEWMQGYVGHCMEEAGIDKIEGRHVTTKFRKSSAVRVLDMDSLPDEYVRETHRFEPNKEKIRAALRAGSRVPGAEMEERRTLVVE